MGRKSDPGAALRAQAQANMAKAAAEIEKVDMPDYMKQQAYINLMAEQVPELAGVLQAEELDRPEDIQEDPRLAGAQAAALEALSERGKAGLSEEDQLKYEDARAAMASDAASQQADIERRMAERGAGGSGQELAMRLAGQQGQAQRASEFGRGMAADALQAKMQSEQAAGAMAGQMSAQDIARQRANEQAKQQIAQFNAANRMSAQQQNLAARQSIANQRAGLQQQKYGQLGGLEQQKFSNQMAKAGAMSGAYTGQANMLAQQAGQMGGGPSKGGAALSGAASGAATGASIGGGYGAAIGAGVGAIGGYMSAEDGGIVPAKEHYQADSGSYMFGGVGGMGQQMQLAPGVAAPTTSIRSGDGLSPQHTPDSLKMKYDYMNNEKFGDDPYKKAMYGKRPSFGESKEAFMNSSLGRSLFGGGNEDSAMQKVAAAKPDARDTGAPMPAESPAAKTQDAAAKGAGKGMDKSKAAVAGLEALSNIMGGGQKAAPAQPWKNIEAPQIALPQDQVFGRPFADGGIPGIIAEDGSVTSIDAGFVFPGEEDEYAGDRVDAKVNRGEMILNAEQQQRMLDVLRGEASPEVLHNGEDVVETPEEAQTRGFLKILEMIGKK